MTISYIHMAGCGNSYIFVDADRYPVSDPAGLAVRVSNPKTGLGSDGLVLISRCEDADVRMRIFNADGSEALMCGNALRCMGRIAWEEKMCASTDIKVSTPAGMRRVWLTIEEGRVVNVRAAMGQATSMQMMTLHAESKEVEAQYVEVGNPHAIVLCEEVSKAPVRTLGPVLETLDCWADRCNIEWVEIEDAHRVKARVWERGSGETQACGTGACAIAACLTERGICESPLSVDMPGGELQVKYEGGELYLTAPVERIAEGSYTM